MDKGEIVEFDNACDLLEKGQGHLYDLAASSKDFNELMDLAQQAKARLTGKKTQLKSITKDEESTIDYNV